MAATGVITGLVTLSTPFVAPLQSRSWLGFAGLLLTLAVLYCAVAAAWLAVRAQQVTFWGQAVVDPGDFSSSEKYGLEYCWSLYVIFKENQKRISVPVAYLRDAETFFRAVICRTWTPRRSYIGRRHFHGINAGKSNYNYTRRDVRAAYVAETMAGDI